jgi:hypothetical protein
LANQQQFEGPVLEDLLERVRAEVGKDARIVAANRVRKGGIAGFFSRQAFEVLVEPVEPAAAPRPTPTPRPNPAPVSILDLADAVSDDERNDVIDLVDDYAVSTESREFAQMLDRFSRSIDAPEHALASEDEPPAPLPNEPNEPGPYALDDDDLVALAPDTRTSSSRENTRRVVPTNEVIDRIETRLSRMGLPARLIPRGVVQSEMKGALVESLVRLPPPPRVPAGLGVVIVIVGASAAPVLLARELAEELDLDADDVVLATREHLGDGIPAWLQMNDPDTAHARRRSWQRRDQPTIVACSLPAMHQSLRWAREMLDQLEPTITWAIIDAGWKREDIVHRIDALGGVDVLALDNLDDTVSPATALDLGIPVGRLASEHASPLTWTELFLERMRGEQMHRERANREHSES